MICLPYEMADSVYQLQKLIHDSWSSGRIAITPDSAKRLNDFITQGMKLDVKDFITLKSDLKDPSFTDLVHMVGHQYYLTLTTFNDQIFRPYINTILQRKDNQDPKLEHEYAEKVGKLFEAFVINHKLMEQLYKHVSPPSSYIDEFNDQLIRTMSEKILELLLQRGEVSNRLKECAKNDYSQIKIDPLANKRDINLAEVQKIKSDIAKNPTENSDLELKYIDAVVRHTHYISTTEFMNNLRLSLEAFLKAVGDRPYGIVLFSQKYGSEYWILQQLFARDLKGREPPVLYKSNPEKDPTDIMIIDDAIYSGMNVSIAISDFLSNVKTDKKYTFHIVVPYVSTRGYEIISEDFKDRANLIFYPAGGHTIPSLKDIDPKLWDDIIADEYIVQKYDIVEDNPHTLIYFDHKIADARATANEVLERLVPPISKDGVHKSELCFFSEFLLQSA